MGAVALTTDKGGEQQGTDGEGTEEGRRRPPGFDAGSRGVHEDGHPGRDERGTREVELGSGASGVAPPHDAGADGCSDEADWDVDEEDPTPVHGFDEHA